MPARKKPLIPTESSPVADTTAKKPKRAAHPRKKAAKHQAPPMVVIAEAKPASAPASGQSHPAKPSMDDQLARLQARLPSPNQTASRSQSAGTPKAGASTTTKVETTPKPKPAPGPLVRTRYNKTWIGRGLASLGVIALAGLSVAVWTNRSWIFPSFQKVFIRRPVTQLHVTKEVINQARLAAIPQASQASTPAQATAAPNLKPRYIDPAETTKPTTELFSDLKVAQTSLQQQHINDNQALQHYLDLATAAQNRHDDATARTQLLEGLELANELQILHDYYAK